MPVPCSLKKFKKINKAWDIKYSTSMFVHCRGHSVSASIILVVPTVTDVVRCIISFHGVLGLHLMEHNASHASVMDMPPAVVTMLQLQLLTSVEMYMASIMGEVSA